MWETYKESFPTVVFNCWSLNFLQRLITTYLENCVLYWVGDGEEKRTGRPVNIDLNVFII